MDHVGGDLYRPLIVLARAFSYGPPTLPTEVSDKQRAAGGAISGAVRSPMATPNCSTYGHPNCSRQDG